MGKSTIDITIIGAGIVGLATGLRLLEKKPGLRVRILEKEDQVALHQSGNNSGVIHSGVYYKPGSLRATNCIRGYNMLVDFCQTQEIEYDICGKIIVATQEKELGSLQTVYERGVANGLDGIRLIGEEEIREKEPHAAGIRAIWVPQAGIVDFRKVCAKYAELFKSKGGEIVTGAEVREINQSASSTIVICDKIETESKFAINCGGLYSDRLAKLVRQDLDIQILPFRGEYYKLRPVKENLVKNLIYPAPDPDFPWLGVHFTRMMRGGVEAGPNAVLAFKREGYKMSDFDFAELKETLSFPGFRKMAARFWRQGLDEYYRSLSKRAFTTALQRLLPELQMDDLIPGGAGVRALACKTDGSLVDDFVIYDDKRVINVCNAPSPAATSSLSIGETIAEMVEKKLVSA